MKNQICLLSFLLLLGCLLSLPLAGQEYQYKLTFKQKQVDGEEGDYIYLDMASKTLDLFFVAREGRHKFWSFNEDNLKITETYQENTTSPKVIYQGKITDPTHFGEQSVYQVKFRPADKLLTGKRTYKVEWLDNNQQNLIDPVIIEKNWPSIDRVYLGKSSSFPLVLVICLGILALLLLALSEFIPIFDVFRFKRKYVFAFADVQKEGERKLNSVTGRPLQPQTQVVKMCDRDICCVPLKQWERKNYQCYHCPDRCDGNLNVWTRKFFKQQGRAKLLNWIWFGMAGGALAWVIQIGMGNVTDQLEFGDIRGYLALGFSIGMGFSLMLSLVEELGQSREFSWSRILLRTLIATAISTVLFGGFAYLESKPGLIFLSWLLFCSSLGLVISYNSSIPWRRGLVSGLAAGAVSGLVYGFFPRLFSSFEDPILLKMITLLLAGAILGTGIIQIVKRLSKIEFQVLAPATRSGMIYSLDNFLRSGAEVIIGKDFNESTVRIKWEDDQVLPLHASLTMEGNVVRVAALKGAELWVDDNRLLGGESQVLKGGELIQPGRKSKTVFRYIQKA